MVEGWSVPSDVEVAWFAGLFEGEGSFEIGKNGLVRLTIAITDRDVIERVEAMFPTGYISVRPSHTPVKSNGGKPRDIYAWRVSGPGRVRTVIDLMLPLLGERRTARAREVLESIDSRPIRDARRNSTHCRRGHELTPENSAVRADKPHLVRCRTCQRERSRESYERKLANGD